MDEQVYAGDKQVPAAAFEDALARLDERERVAHHLHRAQERQVVHHPDHLPWRGRCRPDDHRQPLVEEPPGWRACHPAGKGREYAGVAEAITDEMEVTRILKMMLREHPGYGKYIGAKLGTDDRANRKEVENVARERVVVRA